MIALSSVLCHVLHAVVLKCCWEGTALACLKCPVLLVILRLSHVRADELLERETEELRLVYLL